VRREKQQRLERGHACGTGIAVVPAILLEGRRRTKDNLKQLRAAIKTGLKPTQAMLDRFAGTFLIGKPINVTMEELLREDAAQATRQRQKSAKAAPRK
jgi:hypothetical protein